MTPERKKQLRVFLAERGQSAQWFLNRALDEAMAAAAAKEKN